MVDARLPDGSRVNAVIPPLAVNGPMLTIRKFSHEALRRGSPGQFDTLRTIAEFLGAASGQAKHPDRGRHRYRQDHAAELLSRFIPESERIVTIEDAAELRLHRSTWSGWRAPANVEGRGEVTIRDLVRNALRMRPDRIIVGEVRGGEALDMLQAMNTGHDGSLTTIHANTPRDALPAGDDGPDGRGRSARPGHPRTDRLGDRPGRAPHRLRDGTRRIVGVDEVDGMEGDTLTSRTSSTSTSMPAWTKTGCTVAHWGDRHPSGFSDRLPRAGIELSAEVQEPRLSKAGGDVAPPDLPPMSDWRARRGRCAAVGPARATARAPGWRASMLRPGTPRWRSPLGPVAISTEARGGGIPVTEKGGPRSVRSLWSETPSTWRS